MDWHWIAFAAFICAMLVLDLGVFHRRAHSVAVREAASWVGVWVGLAAVFAAGVFLFRGRESGLQFVAGYVIEQSLSMDNVFLFAVIFNYFKVPARYRHRVLFWGILGALAMRGLMIWGGVALISRFHWVVYVFGAFLVFTGIKMFLGRNNEMDPADSPAYKLVRRFMRVSDHYEEQRFFIRIDGALVATPLFMVLVMIEFTDLVFAVDSIPAVFAVSRDPFIVYTSNVFAILGLRSLYFLLAGWMDIFRYLNVGLSIVLAFVGIKMLLSTTYPIPIGVSLTVIILILGVSMVASIAASKREIRKAVRRDNRPAPESG